MRPHVYGRTVDDETRCVHYATAVDIIAIRFACCDRYYPCHACHAEAESHPVVVRRRAEWDAPGILCGACGTELSVTEYRAGDACPACDADFNPRCRLHWDRYFEP
ncbi:MAG: CHY zinc finger protein [Agromyces sp.]